MSSIKEETPAEKFTDDTAEKPLDIDEEEENSPIEAVRMAVPITDDPTLPVITFRFWLLGAIFTAIGAVITQYNFFRTTYSSYSIFFVNLSSFYLGKLMARFLPTFKVTLFGQEMSLNPGPFNIKEHAAIGITCNAGAAAAYAVDILATTDLFLNYRISAIGGILMIITTQCVGYGMAGLMRKYVVYPAEMVWWQNLIQVSFYNTMHNTDDYKKVRLIFGWTRMKFFWIVCAITFFYQFIPQWMFPLLMYFDWVCWIKPFDRNIWAIFSSAQGGGAFALSFDWTSIQGQSMYYPLYSQLCTYLGMIFNYWILVPIFWLNNIWGTRVFGRPLTPRLFFPNGTIFDYKDFRTPDHSLDVERYDALGVKVTMAPMYALGFFMAFTALTSCISHIGFFHGRKIIRTFRAVLANKEEDVHTRMMKAYPEVPHWWYAVFYVVMAGLSIFCVEYYKLQLPWWGLIVALVLGFVLTLPIGIMNAVTGYGPGLSVISELICGYMLPGKPIANMVFKCYGEMAMYQCNLLLQDLKLGHYMKIAPRALLAAQLWGSLVGAIFNWVTQHVIINNQRDLLDGTRPDKNGLWTGNRVANFWGSGLIYGALGPARMFSTEGKYGWVYYGFLVGLILPAIQWGLSKKFPKIKWRLFNVTLIANGMSKFPNAFTLGILPSLIVAVIFQGYLARYKKDWWNRYTFILAAAMDTGAAFTGLFLFLFLAGGVSENLRVEFPSWWGNHYTEAGDNFPYGFVNRCGAPHSSKPAGWTNFNPAPPDSAY
ncbi:hypothetical protein DFQ27_001522 [Actinomortierella ambigua]|uniref:OPT oligopeptide transporter protein-domain-containing protein n=1 Tax=Actinomortierella ambigua TaxID=1343610 RepID=A0A9P6QA27_9FUNG|nr:hypothetical protein DFQ27_001522 [Actinomortierella ambigua]